MPASSTLSASSFGVRCRAAPSTSAIMRSRKLDPAAALMRITSVSDNTRVPPVTALRSPPDSRTTGADSPVMADSSTVATPETIVPSPGITSPASHFTKSPTFSCVAGTSVVLLACSLASRLATVCERVLRSESACALPRPSAMASAKLANSTVNHSQATTCAEKASAGAWVTRSRTSSALASAATSAVMKITGFFASEAGLSLRKESATAGARSFLSNSDCFCAFMATRPQ